MSSDYPKEGHLALITGGSSGIGLALAKKLTRKGVRTWLLGRHMERLRQAQEMIQEACAGRVLAEPASILQADVSDPDQVFTAINILNEKAGIPDLIFNCAGVAHPGYVQELDLKIYQEMMATNYFGTVYVVKSVLPQLLQRGSGYIVNVSSVAGFLGVFGYTAYGASKYAVRGYSDVLRAELKPLGIQVSIVFPPDTDTPQLHYENQYKPMETKYLASSSKILSAEEVADSILKGIQKKQYIILPGTESKLLYYLTQLLGNGVYPIMDWMINRARRNGG